MLALQHHESVSIQLSLATALSSMLGGAQIKFCRSCLGFRVLACKGLDIQHHTLSCNLGEAEETQGCMFRALGLGLTKDFTTIPYLVLELGGGRGHPGCHV